MGGSSAFFFTDILALNNHDYASGKTTLFDHLAAMVSGETFDGQISFLFYAIMYVQMRLTLPIA